MKKSSLSYFVAALVAVFAATTLSFGGAAIRAQQTQQTDQSDTTTKSKSKSKSKSRSKSADAGRLRDTCATAAAPRPRLNPRRHPPTLPQRRFAGAEPSPCNCTVIEACRPLPSPPHSGKRRPLTAPAQSGSTPIPASITSPAHAGTAKPNRQIHDGSRRAKSRLPRCQQGIKAQFISEIKKKDVRSFYFSRSSTSRRPLADHSATRGICTIPPSLQPPEARSTISSQSAPEKYSIQMAPVHIKFHAQIARVGHPRHLIPFFQYHASGITPTNTGRSDIVPSGYSHPRNPQTVVPLRNQPSERWPAL